METFGPSATQSVPIPHLLYHGPERLLASRVLENKVEFTFPFLFEINRVLNKNTKYDSDTFNDSHPHYLFVTTNDPKEIPLVFSQVQVDYGIQLSLLFLMGVD